VSREAWIAIGIAVVVIGVITLYGAIRLVIKLFRMRHSLGDLTTGGKIAFYGSLLYTVFPLDLLPDPIYLDDMAVLGTALIYLTKLVRKRGGAVPLPRGRSTVDSARPTGKPRT
jgi:hypothetical protein